MNFRFLFILLVFSFTLHARAEPLPNSFCPVMKDERASADFKIIHEGKDVFFCCEDCIRDFESEPAAYTSELPQFSVEKDSPPFDKIWNVGVAYAGLSLGGVAMAGLGILRLLGRKISGRAVVTVIALACAGEAVSAHLNRLKVTRDLNELGLENWIHFATFHDYGFPPVPSKPKKPARVSATFYRGNDERDASLFNGGYYRTATFDLSLVDSEGFQREHNDSIQPDDLFLKVVIRRAPGTADYFWGAERMGLMYATRSADKFQGRQTPVEDAVDLTTLEPEQAWEFRYPLADFYRKASVRTTGIIYLCERRFDEDDKRIGGRFHFAFQFDLHLKDARIQADSDLWMGALYRSRIVPIWHIPESEWLSSDPIPVIEGGHNTRDPKILGITADKEDKN